jgi:hypothetical protein
MHKKTTQFGFTLALAVVIAGSALVAQTRPAATTATSAKVTAPKEEWGKNIGDDYFLANYQQTLAYWKKLDAESSRMQVVEIGKTGYGKPQVMAIITAPENFAKLERYKEISRRLALAENLTDAEARAMAKEGKSVLWIDGGLHATEVLGAQQLLEMVYQMVSRTDEETMRFLNDVILLCVPANPDGMDLVSDQYMKFGGGGVPVLYNRYAGHDDNRDSFMNALPETENISRVMYREWFPQVMYNHHQTGPQGTVMFAPPFRDPFNYNFHPMTPANVDLIGSVMATRFIEEGKPGVTTRKGSSYSTWWNGGLRTAAYFHNMIGILTETIGNPTPTSIPFAPNKIVPDSSMWWPIKPQEVWHFRQSIEYSITANRAVLDYASRYRETSLYRMYQMGKDNIKWGNEDHWTYTPHKTEKITRAACGAAAGGGARGGFGGGGGGGRGGGGGCPQLYAALTSKETRDPQGFIMPADSPDFGTSVRFVNALIKSGIIAYRATASFTVGGKQYPANSLVVKSGQAFRPHVMDMFEPQDHPDDIPYPGAAPLAPYDNAGYTLAFQMGVQFDRILDSFTGPFERLTGFATVPAGAIRAPQTVTGYYFSHKSNDSFIAVNRLIAAREDVSWMFNGPLGYGTFYVANKATTRAVIAKLATDLGVSFEGTATAPTGPMAPLRRPRIGLVDRLGGSMPVGWTRLIFKNFEVPFIEDEDDVFPPDLNAGNLKSKYDVLVFNEEPLSAGGGGGGGRGGGGGGAGGGTGGPVSSSGAPCTAEAPLAAPTDAVAAAAAAGGGAAPAAGAGGGRGAGGRGAGGRGAGAGGDAGAAGAGAAGAPQAGGAGGGRGGGRGGQGTGVRAPGDDRPDPIPVAEKYTRRQGQLSAEGIAALKQFVQDGGTIIAIGNSANAAIQMFNLPLTNHLVKPDGCPLQRTDYYVPGSVLRVAVDPKNPLAHGYGDQTDVFFENAPVWRLGPSGAGTNLRTVAWYPNAEPLRSGWAWGQKYLDKGIQMVEANVGQGRVFVFGNELLFRSQPHGTYKFFFNALYLSVAPTMKAGLGQ